MPEWSGGMKLATRKQHHSCQELQMKVSKESIAKLKEAPQEKKKKKVSLGFHHAHMASSHYNFTSPEGLFCPLLLFPLFQY